MQHYCICTYDCYICNIIAFSYFSMTYFTGRIDTFGALSSSICLIHCLLTPFIFAAQACTSSCCETTPFWWQWIDCLFLFLSFYAVYRSAKTTSKNWLKYGLWLSWCLLFLFMLNEAINWAQIPENAHFIPAFSLIALHLYNQKFCQCQGNNCCIDNNYSYGKRRN